MRSELFDESVLDLAHRHALSFLHGIGDRHAGARATHDELMAALRVPLSDAGEGANSVIEALAAEAERGTVGNVGPRYFGFVIGGSIPVSLAADWMTSTWDQNAGMFSTSPLASAAEEIAAEWLLDLFG